MKQTATSGVFQTSAKLFASVDGQNPRKLEWSKAQYNYGDSSNVMVPVMTAGKKILGVQSRILKFSVQLPDMKI